MTPAIRPRLRGITSGVLAGAVGVGVGYLVAGLTGPVGAPVVAVASLVIDLSPPPVKNFAISTFGSSDKLALQTGVLVILAVAAALIGLQAQRRLANGMVGVLIFAVVGLTAAGTRPASTPADLLPTLVGAAAAAIALALLTRSARRVADSPVPAGPPARPDAAPAGSTDTQAAGDQAVAARWAPARPPALTVTERPRRDFMLLGAATAGTAAAAYLGGRLLGERASVAAAQRALHLPAAADAGAAAPAGASLRIPGLSSFVTPNSSFYRVDTALVLPQVDPSNWQLRIHGMVRRELTLTFDDLLKRPLIEDYVTLACVSNPVGGPYVGNARWLGASLGALLREAGIRAGADQLFCTSVDGFTSGTPVATAMDGRDALLAVGMNGAPLPVAHGFPVRTVVPGLYGYVSACKWITDIEVTTYASNVAYWAQRGWSAQAPIKTESRIDVPSGNATLRPGRTMIAGVAWAQHKGVDAVEVRLNNGPWHRATLAPVPGIDCWRQWYLPWDAKPGRHVIQARATDATGYTQTGVLSPPEPNGATGYPTVVATVTG